MFSGINKLFENQVSAFPLAVFRITFVFMCLIEAIENTYFRHLIFDFVPYLEPSRISTKPIFFIWIISLLFLLIGFKTRQAAIINYIFTVVVIGHSGIPFGFDWHVDVLLLIGSVLLVLLPVNRYMAVDALLAALKKSSISEEAWENYGQVSFIYKFCLILFVANIYIDSVLWKITSPMYLAGLGFWAPASLPYNTYIDLSYILSFEYLNRFLGFFVLFFEAFFIVLVMFKRLRPWVCLTGIIFHIGILVAFPIPIFSFFMVTFFLGILPVETYMRIGRLFRYQEPQLRIHYVPEVVFARRVKAVVNCFDWRDRIEWIVADAKSEDGYALYIVKNGAQNLTGFAVLEEIMTVFGGRMTTLLLQNAVVRQLIISVWREERLVSLNFAVVTKAPRWQESSKLKLQKYLLSGFLIFWISSIFIISFKSPFYRTYIMPDAAVWPYLQTAAAHYKSIVYPWTGFSDHGLFMDFHFADFDSQLMLTYEQDGEEILLPMTSEQGASLPFNFNRPWALWIFRAVNPTFDQEGREDNIKRFIIFWAYQNDVDLEKGRIVIWGRKVDVSLDEWKADLLTQNQTKAWHVVGYVESNPLGELRFSWDSEDEVIKEVSR